MKFLIEDTNAHEAPEGSVLVIDLDGDTGEITQIGFTRENAEVNEMLSHIDDNRSRSDERVLIVPIAWNESPYIKDVMSSTKHKLLDVLAIDYDQRVFWSVLCNDLSCCPPQGQSA